MVKILINNKTYGIINNKKKFILENKGVNSLTIEAMQDKVDEAIKRYDEIKEQGFVHSPGHPVVTDFVWVND